jgi:acyl dehydratase
MRVVTPDEGAALVGEHLGSSDWRVVTQDDINTFADLTGDWQPIHVDPELAAQSPFGGTIAHGFLTLSLIGGLLPEGIPVVQGATMGLNYGFDKVRFLQPVPTGSRVRAHHVLTAFEDKGAGRYVTTTAITIEIEGCEKPALVADWLGMQYT